MPFSVAEKKRGGSSTNDVADGTTNTNTNNNNKASTELRELLATLLREVERVCEPLSGHAARLRHAAATASAELRGHASGHHPTPSPSTSGASPRDSGTLHSVHGDAESSNGSFTELSVVLHTSSVWMVVLSAPMLRRSKITQLVLRVVQLLCNILPGSSASCLEVHTTILWVMQDDGHAAVRRNSLGRPPTASPSSSPSIITCIVGEGLFMMLAHCLSSAVASSSQYVNTLRLQHRLLESAAFSAHLSGNAIMMMIRALLNAQHARTGEEALRRQNLRTVCTLVVRRFVQDAEAAAAIITTTNSNSNHTVADGGLLSATNSSASPLSCGFVADTPLTDFLHDVGPSTPYTPIHFVAHSASSPDVVPTSTSVDVNLISSGTLPDTVLRDAMLSLTVREEQHGLPTALKNFVVALTTLAKRAARLRTTSSNSSSTGSSSASGGVALQPGFLALTHLELILDQLPAANGPTQHGCSTWLHMALNACKHDLLRGITRCLATFSPFVVFDAAIRVVSLLLVKSHALLAEELHALLSIFVVPLASSRLSEFRQKHAVIAMAHEVLRHPSVVISMWLNVDCSPLIDADGRRGGLLELLIDFLAELAFTDQHLMMGYGSGGRTSSGEAAATITYDQLRLLRVECVVALHAFVQSLHRWVMQDPEEEMEEGPNLDVGSSPKKERYNTNNNSSMRMKVVKNDDANNFLDNWRPSDADEDDDDDGDEGASPSPRPPRPHANTITNATTPPPPLPPTTSSSSSPIFVYDGKRFPIYFHWKHVHLMLHNKHIIQRAIYLINAGKWLEAKSWLEERQYLPHITPSEAELRGERVEAGSSSYAPFAHFLHECGGIERSAVCGIFDRINKMHEPNHHVLHEYLHLFNVAGVPIDIALRDATCAFMSWSRPMFEAKVWEVIQTMFGEVYATQNAGAITAKDADTMAGVLLFLHSNLHNQLAKNSRMSIALFVESANECLDFPMEEQELRAMYSRTSKTEWCRDVRGLSPKQCATVAGRMKLSTRMVEAHSRHVVAAFSTDSNNNNNTNNKMLTTSAASPEDGSPLTYTGVSDATAAVGVVVASVDSNTNTTNNNKMLDSTVAEFEESQSCCVVAAVATSVEMMEMGEASMTTMMRGTQSDLGGSFPVLGLNLADLQLLDGSAPSYETISKNNTTRESGGTNNNTTNNNNSNNNKGKAMTLEQQYVEVAERMMKELEKRHWEVLASGNATTHMPYLVPHYAEHVRQILLMAYPKVMAAVYVSTRLLEEVPVSFQLVETMELLHDVAALLGMELDDVREPTRASIRAYAQSDGAYPLEPPLRSTFTPFLLQFI